MNNNNEEETDIDRAIRNSISYATAASTRNNRSSKNLIFTAQKKSSISSIEVGQICMQSSPCKHDVIIHYKDGREVRQRMSEIDIADKVKNIGRKWRCSYDDVPKRQCNLM